MNTPSTTAVEIDHNFLLKKWEDAEKTIADIMTKNALEVSELTKRNDKLKRENSKLQRIIDSGAYADRGW